MRRLLTALVAAALAGAAPVTARAGACPFLADFAGDATAAGSAVAGANDPALDLLGADLATTGKGLAVRIRVASLAIPDTASPLGTAYVLQFTTPRYPAALGNLDTHSVYAVLPTAGLASGGWGSGAYGAIAVEGQATVDVSGATLTITARTAAFAKGVLGNVRVTAYRLLVPGTPATQPFYGIAVDRADTTRGYRGGSPGCVAVRV